MSTAAGFFFWIICAHTFQTRQVGLATSLISYVGLAASLTSFGLSNTILRFLPTSKRKGGLIVGSILVVLIASLLGGLVEVLELHRFIPRLGFVDSSILLSAMLIFLVIGTNVSALMDSVLLAFRKAKFVLGKSVLISGLRLSLPFFVAAFGLSGILAIYAGVFWVGIVYGLAITFFVLLPRGSLKPTVNDIISHRAYSASNYLGGMLGLLPSTLAPIIILIKLGPSSAAYYYMPMQVSAFLSILSSSVSQALISETSQTDDSSAARAHFRNALIHLYRLLVPAVGALLVAGWFILRAYGPAYAANGFMPLVILALASLLVGINWLGDTWLNIQKRHKAYFYMNAFNAVAVVAAIYFMASKGLAYAALGALLGQAVSSIVYLVIFGRDQLFSPVLASRTR